jgi:predicted nucleic acid-binding protein
VKSTILLDSSAWIEIIASGPKMEECLKELKSAGRIIVPTLVIFEVYRKVTQMVSEEAGLSATALLNQYEVVVLSSDVALTAADISIQHALAMPDSLVLAHARTERATLVTLDNDFATFHDAKVIRA